MMKQKYFLLTIVFAVFSFFVIDAQSFKYGLTAGFDISNIRYGEVPSEVISPQKYELLPGYNANLYLAYKTAGFLGFSIEPGFIRKGSKLQSYDFITEKEVELKYKLSYLHFPILLDFYLTDRLFFSAGPELAFLLKAESEYNNNSHDLDNIFGENFELSGVLGISYEIHNNIDLGFRYSHGLTEVSEIQYTDRSGNPAGRVKEYNHYFQFLARFKLESSKS